MILFFESGRQIRGDAIIYATLRSDLSPVPLTLEAEITTDGETRSQLEQGKTLTTGSGIVFEIVKREAVQRRAVRDDRLLEGVRITALLQSCLPIAYVRERAVIKESTTLSAVYRAVGARIRGIDADFNVPLFSCLVGQTPSFAIRQILQEQGGSVRWKSGGLQFRRYDDLFKQDARITIPGVESADTQSGFLERHTVPNYFSTDETGTVIHGARAKARTYKFTPGKGVDSLNRMTKTLIQRQVVKVPYDLRISAGDAVNHLQLGTLVVVTAVHEMKTDSEGMPDQYSRLFLASLES
ncbi:MAG: hypothetical protein CMI13_12200 [Oleibacter sp.]|nr:hypothetical protein [Thalassolituus sp.]